MPALSSALAPPPLQKKGQVLSLYAEATTLKKITVTSVCISPSWSLKPLNLNIPKGDGAQSI